MKINLKGKKGFTTIDLSIAMIVIIIFVVIMTSISYNIYLSSIEAKRTAVALNYAVDILEYIGELNFASVTESMDLSQIDSLKALGDTTVKSTGNNVTYISASIGSYDIDIKIEDYKNGGVVKIVTLTITFTVSRNDTQTIEIARIKVNK